MTSWALGLTRYLSSLLFEVSNTDASTFLVAAALVITTTILAALIPALRAATLDPANVLRDG